MKKLFYIFLCVLFIPVLAYAGWRTLSDGTLKPTGTGTNVEIEGSVSAGGADTSAPAAITSFAGTVSASSRTVTFSSAADWALCKVGSTLIADGDTRIIVAIGTSPNVTVGANTTWAGSTAITSLQEPIAQMKLADGTVVGYINALGGQGYLGGIGSLQKGFVFGDGDSGFYEGSDDNLGYATGGLFRAYFTNGGIEFAQTGRASIRNEAASSTNPVHTFYDDYDTGLGRAVSDQLSLIAGGVEGIRITEDTGAITTSMTGDVDVVGELTAGTKTFLVDHPLQPLTKNLVHMAIEGPRVDLIYRGTAMLKDGKATVNLDTDSTVHPMLAGTFDALTQNAICTSLQNQTSFNRLKPSQITNGKFTIECKDPTATDVVAWVVMAERRDPFIKSCSTTDENGRLIPEQDKEAPAADALADKTEIVTDAKDVGETTVKADVAGKAGYPRHYKAYGIELPTRKIIKTLKAAAGKEAMK